MFVYCGVVKRQKENWNMTLELTMVLLLNNRSDFEDTTKIVWQFHFKMKNVPFCSLAYIFIILTSTISDIYLDNEKNKNI